MLYYFPTGFLMSLIVLRLGPGSAMSFNGWSTMRRKDLWVIYVHQWKSRRVDDIAVNCNPSTAEPSIIYSSGGANFNDSKTETCAHFWQTPNGDGQSQFGLRMWQCNMWQNQWPSPEIQIETIKPFTQNLPWTNCLLYL